MFWRRKEEKPFRPLEATYPIIRQWAGIIATTPKFRHELWALDCREKHSRMTHVVWVVYRPVGRDTLHILHRGQYAIALGETSSRSNWIARQMVDVIGRLMSDMEPSWLLETTGEMPQLFWPMLIEKSYQQVIDR